MNVDTGEFRALEKRVAKLERRMRYVAKEAGGELVRVLEASAERAAHAEAVRERRHLKVVETPPSRPPR